MPGLDGDLAALPAAADRQPNAPPSEVRLSPPPTVRLYLGCDITYGTAAILPVIFLAGAARPRQPDVLAV
jgi:hypothetical protein